MSKKCLECKSFINENRTWCKKCFEELETKWQDELEKNPNCDANTVLANLVSY